VARILIVEDSAVDRHLIGALLLKQTNWDLDFAANGLEALQYLERMAASSDNSSASASTSGVDSQSNFSASSSSAKRTSKVPPGLPDVIVTDLRMPEMDGLELVRAVRQNYSRIPVVLITSYGSEQIAMDALRAGATNFSPKDSLRHDLVRTVTQVLALTEHMRFEPNPAVHPAAKQIAFVLENEMSFIGPTIEHLQENLPAWSDRDRLQIGMALDEALTNAMHHGNLEVDSCIRDDDDEDHYYKIIRERKTLPPFCHRRIRIEVEFSDRHVCIQITDDGPGFDPSKIPDPTEEENLHRVCGRGLFLIKSFMDSVAHNKVGNQITMTKLRREE
jgi:CheY-like chemotaxis protein/anti-sigma regulatory factor (Ser/Thr protein kinase)